MPEVSELKEMTKKAFPDKAWAYTVMHQGVAIGTWEKDDVKFHKSAAFCWNDVLELRVFHENRELRFTRNENGKFYRRDSDCISHDEVRHTAYLMYGTDAKPDVDEWIVLKEGRGGALYFPRNIADAAHREKEIIMWLGIRNYLRFTTDLRLEVCDYTFTGFKKGMAKREVQL
jgi:CRISPR-associated protein (TIGR03984 family)